MLVTCNGIEIDQKHVCRYLGYSADYPPPARILSLTEYAKLANHLIRPAYSHTIKSEANIHA